MWYNVLKINRIQGNSISLQLNQIYTQSQSENAFEHSSDSWNPMKRFVRPFMDVVPILLNSDLYNDSINKPLSFENLLKI